MPPGIRKDKIQRDKENHPSIFSDAPFLKKKTMRKASSITLMREKSLPAEQSASCNGACEPRDTHTTAILMRWEITRLPQLPGWWTGYNGSAFPSLSPVLGESNPKRFGEILQAGTAVAAWPTALWHSQTPGIARGLTDTGLGSRNAIRKCHFLLPDMFKAAHRWHGPGGPQVHLDGCYCHQGQEHPALFTPL